MKRDSHACLFISFFHQRCWTRISYELVVKSWGGKIEVALETYSPKPKTIQLRLFQKALEQQTLLRKLKSEVVGAANRLLVAIDLKPKISRLR